MIHVLILALYKLFVCMLTEFPSFVMLFLFTSLLVYFLTDLSTPSRTDPQTWL